MEKKGGMYCGLQIADSGLVEVASSDDGPISMPRAIRNLQSAIPALAAANPVKIRCYKGEWRIALGPIAVA